MFENEPVKVNVKQDPNSGQLQIDILSNQPLTRLNKQQILTQLERILGTQCDLRDFYSLSKHDPYLWPLINQFMGMKPPRYSTLFETLVNAISCQHVSLDAGLQIQNNLVRHMNLSLEDEGKMYYAFPRPQDVAKCSIADLYKLGYSTQKSETLIRMATLLADNDTPFRQLENFTNQEIMSFLAQFKGIGRWTGEYLMLRGLGRLDVFPGDDIGAQNNLQKLLHLEDKLDYKKIATLTKKWFPYAGLVYLHLLLAKLHEHGDLAIEEPSEIPGKI